MNKKNKKTIWLYLFPAVLMVVIILYLPIFINLYESFFSWGAMSTRHEFVGFENYIKMFQDDIFYIAMKNNLSDRNITFDRECPGNKVYKTNCSFFPDSIFYSIAFDGDGCRYCFSDDL